MDLLYEINSRTMALPDFQRDFVWDPNATEGLINSIASNYPAGSILRVRDANRMFAAREFANAPKLDSYRHTFLVLDGQQRLTSLYQAFYGVGDYRYYLSLRKLIESKEFEEAIFHLKAKRKKAIKYELFENQVKDLVLPLSVLKDGNGQYSSWALKAARMFKGEEREEIEVQFAEIQKNWIDKIDHYSFPVVTLSDKTKPDALCTIFETLNSTGVKLTVFELLTARFWPKNIKLREMWEAALESYPILSDYGIDPYYILQAIALLSKKSPSCKRSDVLDLESADITAWWNKTIVGMAHGLILLRDDCKVMLAKWIPYQTMLVPLAAILAKRGVQNTPETGVQRDKLQRWFWCAVFGQAYENAPNSQSAKDYNELFAWLENGPLPDSIQLLRFDPKVLRGVAPRQRALYRGTICLILGAGSVARDFHTKSVIDSKLMIDESIDDHHIFPERYLRETKKITSSVLRDNVLNRTLISRTTNQIIHDKAPSKYFKKIKETPGFPFNEVLESHFLPIEDTSPLLNDDYMGYLSWREEKLWSEIKKVTGLTEASEHEEDEE